MKSYKQNFSLTFYQLLNALLCNQLSVINLFDSLWNICCTSRIHWVFVLTCLRGNIHKLSYMLYVLKWCGKSTWVQTHPLKNKNFLCQEENVQWLFYFVTFLCIFSLSSSHLNLWILFKQNKKQVFWKSCKTPKMNDRFCCCLKVLTNTFRDRKSTMALFFFFFEWEKLKILF